MSQKCLNIIEIVDGKPGHVNQVKGLVEAIQRKVNTSVRTIDISIGLVGFIRKVSQFDTPAKLVVAAGHRTHKYALIMRFIFGAYSVVLMKPSLPRSAFNLCFIPRHDRVSEMPNTVVTDGAINRIRPSSSLEQSQGLILLGGLSSHFNWSSGTVVAQIKTLLESYPDVEWRIANSRRTPADVESVLHSSQIILPFFNYADVGAEWMLDQLSRIGHIWVTEDSISMVFEAMTAGARVGVLKLDKTKPNRVSREVARLLSEGRVSDLTTLETKNDGSNTQALIALDEATRCADIVMARMVEKGYTI